MRTKTRHEADCPTFERVNSLLRYDPETGLFYWRVSLGSNGNAGDFAGCLISSGHVVIGIDYMSCLAQRVAHLLMTGHWPHGYPYHENHIFSDNRWANIRELTTNFEVNSSKGVQRNNTSGLKGIHGDIRRRKWQAGIKVNYRRISLGRFDDLRLAGLTYDAAAKCAWGRFAYTNFPSTESDGIALPDRVIHQIESAIAA